jgi:putative redox protein
MKMHVHWQPENNPSYAGKTPDDLTVSIGDFSSKAALDSGRQRKAPTPKELVAMAMGSCSSIDVVTVLQKMKQPLKNLQVDVEVKLSENPPHAFETCLMTYHVEGEGLVESRVMRAVALSVLKGCSVSLMIAQSGCKVSAAIVLNGKDLKVTPEQLTQAAGH